MSCKPIALENDCPENRLSENAIALKTTALKSDYPKKRLGLNAIALGDEYIEQRSP